MLDLHCIHLTAFTGTGHSKQVLSRERLSSGEVRSAAVLVSVHEACGEGLIMRLFQRKLWRSWRTRLTGPIYGLRKKRYLRKREISPHFNEHNVTTGLTLSRLINHMPCLECLEENYIWKWDKVTVSKPPFAVSYVAGIYYAELHREKFSITLPWNVEFVVLCLITCLH